MAKLVLDDLANLRNETTAVARINSNNQKIEDALENTLSRDGTSPNVMTADLDMNSNRIRNHGEPESADDLVTRRYIDDYIADEVAAAAASASAAATSATAADGSADAASTSAANAAASEAGVDADAATAVSAAAAAVAARDAALAALSDAAEIATEFPRVSIATLKGLDTTQITTAYVTDTDKQGLFYWDSADHSATLTLQTITNVPCSSATDTFTPSGGVFHYLDTGTPIYSPSGGSGITAMTIYYAIRVSRLAFKVATSFANALAGTAVDLTASSPVTWKQHGDGFDAIYIIPTGKACDGSQGAWRRVIVNNKYDMTWWGVSVSIAKNEALITSSLNVVPNGSHVYFPRFQTPISKFCHNRWRSGLTIVGNDAMDLRGDGTASECLRLHQNSTTCIKIIGGGFDGSVQSEMPGLGEAGESALIKIWNLGTSSDWDGSPLYRFKFFGCRADDIENGITTQTNWYNPGTPIPQAHYQYHIGKVLIEACYAETSRNGYEIFCNERVDVLNCESLNTGATITGSATRRGVRIVGTKDFKIAGCTLVGYDESNVSTWGISVEQAGLSDYPVGHRFGGNGDIVWNTLKKWNIGVNVQNGGGPIQIKHNRFLADPETAPSNIATTAIRRNDTGYSEAFGNGVCTFDHTADTCNYTSAFNLFTTNYNGIKFYVSSGGALPSPLVVGTEYFRINHTGTSTSRTFQLALTEGGAAIDLTDAGSGTFEFVVTEFEPVKNRSHFLDISDNVAYGTAIFFNSTGASIVVNVLRNRHVGNAHSTSKFFIQDTFADIPGVEKSAITTVKGNWGLYKSSNTGACINFGSAGTLAGEIAYVDDNMLGWNASHPLVADAGAGTVYRTSPQSNTRLDTALWTTWYSAGFPDFGPFVPGDLTP